jgi:hypothetical protein
MPNWTIPQRKTHDVGNLIKQGAIALLVILWVVVIHREIIDLLMAVYTLVNSVLVITLTGIMVWAGSYLIGHPEVIKDAFSKLKV